MEHNTTKQQEAFVNAHTMIEHLCIGRSTFEALVKNGMPCLRLKGIRRFKISEVEAWLKENNETSAKKPD
jgi:hypothetical protein